MIKEIKTKLSSFEIFTIFRNEENSFILDSAMDEKKLGRFSFISSNPFKVLKYKNTLKNPLDNLQEELKKYKVENKTHLPFIGGAVGYLSYDLGNYIEKLSRTAIDDTDVYDLYFGLYNWVIVVDHLENKTYIATPDLDIEEENKIIRKIEDQINEAERAGIDSICYEEKNVEKTRLKSNFTKSEFEDAVRKVQDYIRQGDIYQANLTQRFSGKTTLSSYELYRDLRRFSPAPFGAFLNFEHSHILSNSPERFIKCVDNKVETRPIKGTRPRGKNREEDLRLQEELRNSEKDRAELLMIVDLERNDIGRISKIGSVKVPELFVIEPYANVNHLVATVVGELEENKDIFDLYRVENQIEKALSKKVWLKSGGYLIIDKTEALTVIDVNTGRFTGNLKLEETVYQTNIEAAIEVCRQLKLRDIGGIVIVDFIDMHKAKYKQEIINILNEEFKKDKRKTEVLGMTKLGLVEITRRRERDSIDKYYLEECYTCEGKGSTKSINFILDDIEKEIIRISTHTSYKDVTIELNSRTLKLIKMNFMYIIENISKKYSTKIGLCENDKINYEKLNIIYNS